MEDRDFILCFIKKNLIFNIISILLFSVSFSLSMIYIFVASIWNDANNMNISQQILHAFWTFNYYFTFFCAGMYIVPYVNNYFISKNIRKELDYNFLFHFLLFIPIFSFVSSCYYLNCLNKINFNKSSKKLLSIKIFYSFHITLFGLILAAVSTLLLVYILEWGFGTNVPGVSLLLLIVIPMILCVTTLIMFLISIMYFIVRVSLSFSYTIKNNHEPLNKKEKLWYIFFPYVLKFNHLAFFINHK